MNKTIIVIALLVVCVFAFAETGRKYEDGNYYPTVVVDYQWSAAQNGFYELIANTVPGSGSLVIDAVIFSSANATFLYFNDSNTAADIGYGYYRVPAGGSIIDRGICLKLAAAAGLYATVGNAAEVQIEYHLE